MRHTSPLRSVAHRQGLVDGGHDPERRQAVVVAFGFCAADADEARIIGGPAVARTIHRMGGPELDPNDLYDKMVAAGTAVLGDESQVADLMQRFADEGVDRLAFLTGFGALPIDRNATSIQLLAKAASHVTVRPEARINPPDLNHDAMATADHGA